MIDVSNLVKTPVISHGKPLKGMYIFLDAQGDLVCKHCTQCATILDKSKFSPVVKYPNKVHSVCRNCKNMKKRARVNGEGGLYKKRLHIAFWRDLGIPLKCYVCSGPFEEVEHVVCRNLRGPDDMTNTLPACAQCNRGAYGKGDRPLCEWLRVERPEYLELVITKVLSYGVDPFTSCEKVTIVPEDTISGRWLFHEPTGNKEYEDITDAIMGKSYKAQRELYMRR